MKSDDLECMLCGRDEWSHHDFEKRAKGCVCPSWDGSDEYLPICTTFMESKGGNCARCEHEAACHPPKAETAVEKGPTT